MVSDTQGIHWVTYGSRLLLRVYRRSGERYVPCCIHDVHRFSGSRIMIWAAISHTRTHALAFLLNICGMRWKDMYGSVSHNHLVFHSWHKHSKSSGLLFLSVRFIVVAPMRKTCQAALNSNSHYTKY